MSHLPRIPVIANWIQRLLCRKLLPRPRRHPSTGHPAGATTQKITPLYVGQVPIRFLLIICFPVCHESPLYIYAHSLKRANKMIPTLALLSIRMPH